MKSEIVGFVFKCISFGIFSGLMYYLFRVYFVPLVRARIQEQEKKQHRQRDHEHGLEQEALIIESHVHQQKQQAEYLIHQVNTWSKQVDQWYEHREQERRRCKALAHARIEQVQAGIKQERFMRATVPGALKKLQHEALRYYEDTTHIDAAFDTIMKTLERKLS